MSPVNEQGSETGRSFKLRIRIGIVESTDKGQANRFVGYFMKAKDLFGFGVEVCVPLITLDPGIYYVQVGRYLREGPLHRTINLYGDVLRDTRLRDRRRQPRTRTHLLDVLAAHVLLLGAYPRRSVHIHSTKQSVCLESPGCRISHTCQYKIRAT